MKEFLLNGPEDYKVMCQEGVKQYVFPLEYSHNAIWDSNVSPEGKSILPCFRNIHRKLCTFVRVRL